MKPTDADLIDRLNALDEREREALLEFLGCRGNMASQRENMLDLLEMSLFLHRTEPPRRN